MEGFKHIFDSAENVFNQKSCNDSNENIYENFRSNSDMFAFIHNCDNPPDKEAIMISLQQNVELFHKYLGNTIYKEKVGYGKNYPFKNAAFNELDSRHIMMSIILFNNIKEKFNTIVEIGGGFGNWLRLNYTIQQFSKWYIIDLPHLSKLQEWCLKKYGVPDDLFKTINAHDYDNFANSNEKIDLVIGAHSLSEFSFEIFFNYFQKVIRKTKYFFYAYHKYSPNEYLINLKMNLILSEFDILINIPSENGNVNNCILVNKSIDKER